MALDLEQVKVTGARRHEAEEILANLPTLNRTLVKPEVTLDVVRALIKVEVEGRHRMTTLQRLVARYNVLEARQNEADLMAYVTRVVKGRE